MRDHKFQMVRIGVPEAGAAVRFNGETEGSYKRLRGIFIALPQVNPEYGATMSLKLGGTDIFDEDHDVRLLTCGDGVSPNDKFFLFEEYLQADGNAFEGRYVDPAIDGTTYPYEAKVFLWLVNETDERD